MSEDKLTIVRGKFNFIFDFKPSETVIDFYKTGRFNSVLGDALHAVQQGAITIKYEEHEVVASKLSDCRGNAVNDETVLYLTKAVKVGNLDGGKLDHRTL